MCMWKELVVGLKWYRNKIKWTPLWNSSGCVNSGLYGYFLTTTGIKHTYTRHRQIFVHLWISFSSKLRSFFFTPGAALNWRSVRHWQTIISKYTNMILMYVNRLKLYDYDTHSTHIGIRTKYQHKIMGRFQVQSHSIPFNIMNLPEPVKYVFLCHMSNTG